MTFEDCDVSLSADEVAAFEKSVGLHFPRALRELYLTCNGGSPNPYVYEDENLDTVVQRCLPLRTGGTRLTAIDAYRTVVVEQARAPKHLFPFAIDAGAEFFLVDCNSEEAAVFFLNSDPFPGTSPLVSLGVGLDEFWTRLKPE